VDAALENVLLENVPLENVLRVHAKLRALYYSDIRHKAIPVGSVPVSMSMQGFSAEGYVFLSLN